MVPGIRASVTLCDVAEPADPAVARVVVGDHDEIELALVRGPGGGALDETPWGQSPEERDYAAWPDALRTARVTIQERLSTP